MLFLWVYFQSKVVTDQVQTLTVVEDPYKRIGGNEM